MYGAVGVTDFLPVGEDGERGDALEDSTDDEDARLPLRAEGVERGGGGRFEVGEAEEVAERAGEGVCGAAERGGVGCACEDVSGEGEEDGGGREGGGEDEGRV